MAQVMIEVQELEDIIRRVVRDELAQILVKEPSMFYVDPNSPLYEDMQDILHRRVKGRVKLHSHVEVWGE